MNKKELVEMTARSAGLSKKEATLAVNAVFETITEALGSGEEVNIPYFGKFHLVPSKERIVHLTNPPKVVPPHYRLFFKASQRVKRVVRELPIDVEIIKVNEEVEDFDLED